MSCVATHTVWAPTGIDTPSTATATASRSTLVANAPLSSSSATIRTRSHNDIYALSGGAATQTYYEHPLRRSVTSDQLPLSSSPVGVGSISVSARPSNAPPTLSPSPSPSSSSSAPLPLPLKPPSPRLSSSRRSSGLLPIDEGASSVVDAGATSEAVPPVAAAALTMDVNNGGGVQTRLHAHEPMDLHSLAQEELLVEDLKSFTNERPLDTINRHSRLFDGAPTTMDSRRQSRLPVEMFDPFGFDVGSEPSPYDTALQYSRNERVRMSFLGPQIASSANGHLGTFPSSATSMMSMASATSSSSAQGHGSATAPSSVPTSPVPLTGSDAPWQQKQRSSSFGEPQSHRASVRASFMMGGMPNGRPNLLSPASGSSQGRSKLSGEIHADTISLAGTASSSKQTLPPNVDYTQSKLYQRTLKAQKALEKDRARAAAKGKISKADLQAQAQELGRAEKRRSTAGSFVSDIGGLRSRSSLGWFHSSSEATLPLPPLSHTPPLPTSRSVSQLPLPSGAHSSSLPPPSPRLDPKYLQQQQQQQPLPPPSPGRRSVGKPSRMGSESASASRGASPVPPPDRRTREASTGSNISRSTAHSANANLTLGPRPPLPLPSTPTSESGRSPTSPAFPRLPSDGELPRQLSRESLGRKKAAPAPLDLAREPTSTSTTPPSSRGGGSVPNGRLTSSPSRNRDLDVEGVAAPQRRTPSPLATRDELTNLPPRVSSIYATAGTEPIFDSTTARRASDRDPSSSSTPASSESSAMTPLTPSPDSPAQLYAQQQRERQAEKLLPSTARLQPALPLLAPGTETRRRKPSFRLFGGRKDENERAPTPTLLQNSTNSNRSAQSGASTLSKTPSKSIKQALFGRTPRAVPNPLPTPTSMATSGVPSSRVMPSGGAKSLPASPIKSSNAPSRPREPMPPIAARPPGPLQETSSQASSIISHSTLSNKLSRKNGANGTTAANRTQSGFFASFGRQRAKSAAATTMPPVWSDGSMPVPPPLPVKVPAAGRHS